MNEDEAIRIAMNAPVPQSAGRPAVSDLYRIAAISCGRDHSLAILDDGKVIGWGGDGSGRIPSDTVEYCSTAIPKTGAVELSTQIRLLSVAAGDGISLGITVQNQVVAWGATAAGIGGRLDAIAPASARVVRELEDIRAIAAADFLFGAIDAAGRVHTWGLNSEGAMGRPTSQINALPGPVTSLPAIKRLAIGKGYMLAMTNAGELCAWGSNAAGQLGLGHLTAVAAPKRVRSKTRFHSVAAGASHALAVSAEGEVCAWGSNHHGQLGREKPAYSTSPLPVELPERAQSVAAGMHFSLALGDSGSVFVWGWNAHGQLGLNDTGDRHFAVLVPGLREVRAIAAGETHAAALTVDGLLGWGNNSSGQIGASNRRQLHPNHFFPST